MTPEELAALQAQTAAQAQAMESAGFVTQSGGGIVGGLVDIGMGINNLQQSKKQLAAAEEGLAKVKESAPSLATPTAYYEAAKNAYDQRLMQMRTEDINRALSSSVQAAGQYGARGLGMAMQAQQQAQQAQRQEAATQQEMQTRAMEQLAGAQLQTLGMQEQRYQTDLTYAYDERKAAQAAKQAAQQQIASGITSTATGAIGMATGMPTLGFEKGGKIQKTPGEFNHNTNEMYVVDGNGEHVGIAVTGGEYVVPPKDAKALKGLSESGSTPLHKFVRRMINRFENA